MNKHAAEISSILLIITDSIIYQTIPASGETLLSEYVQAVLCLCVRVCLYRCKPLSLKTTCFFFLKGIVCSNSKSTQFIIDSHLNGVSGGILQSTVAEMHCRCNSSEEALYGRQTD